VSNLLFLLAAVVVAAVGIAVLWSRSRTPRSVDSGVEGFNKQMEALSPRGERRPPRS
jgi:hypothetical protein